MKSATLVVVEALVVGTVVPDVSVPSLVLSADADPPPELNPNHNAIATVATTDIATTPSQIGL